MVLETLEKLIRRRYNKFTILSIVFFVFTLASIGFALNYYYSLFWSLILLVVSIGFGVAFGFSLKKMSHYHSKLLEVWDERIVENKKVREAATANGLVLGSTK